MKMLSRLTIPVLMVTLLFLGLSLPTHGQNIINSIWTSTPPTVDGAFTQGEWSNPQLNLQPTDYPVSAFVYFVNDGTYLYVLVDAVGDTTNDVNDECLLVFDFTLQIHIDIIGAAPKTISNSFDAVIGLAGSPNNSNDHKIYEFRIPFSHIGSGPGQSIEFCSPAWKGGISMPYDPNTGDNIWPFDLDVENRDTWGTINFASLPRGSSYSVWVGGTLTPVNKLAVLAPYLALIGVVAAVATVYVVKRRRKN